MRLFGGERIEGMIGRLGMDENEPLAAGMLTKQIENAQSALKAATLKCKTSCSMTMS